MTNNKEPFNSLLEWLDPDREKAGQRYEVIRAGLIRMFVSNGLSDAEHCADETIDRVVKRLAEIRETYVGDPAKYFHGVARNIIREARRRREVSIDLLGDSFRLVIDKSDTAECLSKCLGLLPRDKQEFILDYHLYKGHDKIEHHRQMAAELKISDGALRCRAHHVRERLEKCISNCVPTRGKQKTIPDHR